MDAKLVAEAEALHDAIARLERVGLVLDRACLSPERRRAAVALQRLEAARPERPAPTRAPIGFPYPNAR